MAGTDTYFVTSCPVCGRTLHAPVGLLGRRARCGHCGASFVAAQRATAGAALDDPRLSLLARANDLIARANRTISKAQDSIPEATTEPLSSQSTQEEIPVLVLSRKCGERILIGPNIELTVVDVRGDRVRLGLAAPREIPIHRQEVFRRLQDEERAGREGEQCTNPDD